VDLNTLLIAGYSSASVGRKKFETANGIIDFTLGFVEAGFTSTYEGLPGLGFIKQFCITLDFTNWQ